MAERRMISRKIVNSAKFLKMPHDAQSMYFHLIISADDDGVAEGFQIMRMIGASEDSLKLLVAKDFVTILNEDLVSHITNWTEHNKLRADRKADSLYKELLLQVLPNLELVEKKPKKPFKRPSDGQVSDKCQTDVGHDADKVQTSDGQVSAECPPSVVEGSVVEGSVVEGSVVEGSVVKKKSKTKFERFIALVSEAFIGKRIATFEAKINKTQRTKDAFNAFEVIPDNLHERYAEYVERNRGTSVRLDKWLIAVIERNEKDIEYADTQPKQQNTTATKLDEWHAKKHDVIDAEVM